MDVQETAGSMPAEPRLDNSKYQDKQQQQHHASADPSSPAIMPQEQRPRKFIKRYRTEIAASTSSVFSTVAAFPLDSVKTRMQTYRYDGFLDCVRHTYHTERLRGFFRGTLRDAAAGGNLLLIAV